MEQQLLPPLTDPEYAALKADIAARGVQVPVDQDESGGVLDGRHRTRACAELGIKTYPVRVVAGLTDEQKRHHTLAANLTRRHLNRAQRRRLVGEELRRSPDLSDRWLGRLCGVDHKTVGTLRTGMVASGEIPRLEARRGEDGKLRRPAVVVGSPREAGRARAALSDLGGRAPTGRLLTLKAVELCARRRRWTTPPARVPPSPAGMRLAACDFRSLEVEPGSVDLFLTDPPYKKAGIPLWDDLGALAARALKPGGVLAAYAGIAYLPQVLSALGAHLDYFWTAALVRTGSHSLYLYQVSNCWRPVVIFTRGEFGGGRVFRDAYWPPAREKSLHPWQQPLDEAVHYTAALSEAGALVCDPFGGSFTTAVACRRLGRRFVGCDIDPVCVARGQARIAGSGGPVAEEGEVTVLADAASLGHPT